MAWTGLSCPDVDTLKGPSFLTQTHVRHPPGSLTFPTPARVQEGKGLLLPMLRVSHRRSQEDSNDVPHADESGRRASKAAVQYSWWQVTSKTGIFSSGCRIPAVYTDAPNPPENLVRLLSALCVALC